MSTVVGDVSVKVPVPCPLKGTDAEAKAAGKALNTMRSAKALRVRIFISSKGRLSSLYKDSFIGLSSGVKSN